jgi:hypothetical protein
MLNKILKVEEVGDFFNKKTVPLIRLRGKWLQAAGILPESHVIVENPEKGIIILKISEKENKYVTI